MSPVKSVEIRGWTIQDLLAHLNQAIQFRYTQYSTFKEVEVGPVVFSLISQLPHAHRQTIDLLSDHFKRPQVLKVARSFLSEERRKQELHQLEQSGQDVLRTPSAQMALALLRDPVSWRANENKLIDGGVESGQWIIRLKSGVIRKSKLFTDFSAVSLSTIPSLNAALKHYRIELHEIDELSFVHVHPGQLVNASALSHGDLKGIHFFVDYFARQKLYPILHIYAVAPDSGARVVCHYSYQATGR